MNVINEFQEWMDWSVKKFPKADELVSLYKAQDEMDELKEEFEKDPIGKNHASEKEEYADIIMCLLHSAARRGYSAEEIITAFEIKRLANYVRKWKENPDNTYSHVK